MGQSLLMGKLELVRLIVLLAVIKEVLTSFKVKREGYSQELSIMCFKSLTTVNSR